MSSSMALPSLQGRAPSRSRVMAAHMVRHREQAARDRQQWELHARNWKEMNVRTERQVAWSSTQSYQKSMSAYERRSQEEAKKSRLEQRRNRLRALLQEEERHYEAALKELNADRRALEGQRSQEKEAICSAGEDKKHTGRVRKDCWGENNFDVQKGQLALPKDTVISRGQEQISERKRQDEAGQKEKPLGEGCEKTRGQAPDWMVMAEERKEEEEQSKDEELRKLMQELKLREEETTHLKKEQEVLQLKQHELEKTADQMRAVKQKRKESEIGQFRQRHYRAQLRRRVQQVQDELEFDRNILERLLSKEPEDSRKVSERRDTAVADAAWMKRVIEEQLQLERQREVEFDTLHRDEALHVWEKRQAQWEKEAEAREQLMHEVLGEMWQQLKMKMQKNHEAQMESLREREELIQRLELEREARHQKREQEEQRVAAPLQEAGQRQEQMAEEEEDNGEGEQVQNEKELRLEMPRVFRNGYQEKIPSRARSAWT